MSSRITGYLRLSLPLLVVWPTAASADAVVTWNQNAATAATAACLHLSGNGLAESRMYAMMHAAIHDAVNAIDRRSRPYAFEGQVGGAASFDAAVATAARDVLVAVIPTLPESAECIANGLDSVNVAYGAALAAIPDTPAKSNGLAVGRAAAAAIVLLRVNDRSAEGPWADPTYPQGTQPGEWRFTPDFPFAIAFAPNYGNVTPFVLKRSSDFSPRPPHDLGSAKYAADYNEIKQLGGDDITTPSARTADQTEIGLFWIESSPLAWNRLARAISASRALDLWENARLFGLLNLAMADGYIASWEAKYRFKFWRPITAIRLGDTDGNPDTEAVPDWTPLQPTYPIPDHDSGHAVQGGVAAEVLRNVVGTDTVAFTACSTSLAPGSRCGEAAAVIRSYTSFSQAADENALSRIYIGIHFRNAVEEGVRHGRRIGAYAVQKFMRPTP